jgi:Flp pilus assembly protein TadG
MLADRRGAEMAEAAVVLPVVILVLMFVINGSLAGYTAMAAANAARRWRSMRCSSPSWGCRSWA